MTNEIDLKKTIANVDLLLSLYLLKLFSSKEHPVSVRMLMDYMTTITDVEYDNDSFKPIKNHLLNLCGSLNKFQTEEEETLYGYVCSMIGGQLVHLRNGKQHYFYVNPYLTESDRNLITGAITANRYLSPEEKKYLTGVVESLNGFVGEETLDDNSAYQIIPEPMEAERPKPKKNKTLLPADTSELLKNIRTIYRAIEEKQKLSFSYGRYTVDESKLRKITFENNNKVYTISPYAMFWANGQYYLVGAYDKGDNPVHFRVDRISDVVPLRDEKNRLVKNRPAPEILKPYFKTKGKKTVFDSDAYVATYPLMMGGFEKHPHVIDACVECTKATLSLLIDTFGTNLEVSDSTIPHPDSDKNDARKHYIAVKIPNVEYNSILMYCLQHAASVYTDIPNVAAIYPPQLVQDVRTKLMQNVAHYDELINMAKEVKHPFISNKKLG